MDDPANSEEVRRFFYDALSQDRAELEAKYLATLGEALTYREMFLWTMDTLQTIQTRFDRTQERLRQVMGVQPWHEEEAPM